MKEVLITGFILPIGWVEFSNIINFQIALSHDGTAVSNLGIEFSEKQGGFKYWNLKVEDRILKEFENRYEEWGRLYRYSAPLSDTWDLLTEAQCLPSISNTTE